MMIFFADLLCMKTEHVGGRRNEIQNASLGGNMILSSAETAVSSVKLMVNSKGNHAPFS